MGLIYSPFSFHSKKGLWIFWALSGILLGLAMWIIFHFSAANSLSSSGLSQSFSRRILCFIFSIFSRNASEEMILQMVERIEYPIRKMAHFSEFAFLAFLAQLHFYAMDQLKIIKLPQKFYAFKACHLAYLFSVLYAISDEIHQYFIPGRACRIFDVCVDSLGALFGTFIFLLIFLRLLDGVFGKG